MKLQCVCFVVIFVMATLVFGQPELGGSPLQNQGDLASQMVDGIDRFLLRTTDQAMADRGQFWSWDTSTADKYEVSVAENRQRLARMLGVRDARMPFRKLQRTPYLAESGHVEAAANYNVFTVRWPVLADPAPAASELSSLHGEGLLLVPNWRQPLANVIAIPHADHSPEQIAGLVDGLPPECQFARRLAQCGCQVLVPTIVSRERSKRNGRADLTNREYIYRSSFELGRHIIGYEIQKVLAGVDWFTRQQQDEPRPIGVMGYGEGGHLALLAAALDTRIHVACVSGALGYEHNCWNHPLDRNVFGMLREFGTAELCSLVLPRRLICEFSDWPEYRLEGNGGAPSEMQTPPVSFVREELDQAAQLIAPLIDANPDVVGITSVFGDTDLFSHQSLRPFLSSLVGNVDAGPLKASARHNIPQMSSELPVLIKERMTRQVQEMDRHNQALLRESSFVRKEFLKELDTKSVGSYETSVERYRQIFRNDVIGRFDEDLLPFNARSRQTWETDTWTGHEVTLDVFPDVMAYGVLLLPKDLKPGERRPVVVCQHGLEGRPTDTFLNDHRAYHDFAAKLCERGFITFAPQNPYIFKDRFRTLQRKANPLGKSLFSIIVPQHQQIVNWLKSQPFVDSNRIAFYGLSYGGKSAMRIPALVTDYCLSICSADFNEWVLKNASTRENFSYVWTGEYEIFEWDLGSTFNYAEMAALICPRPFMVERGHFDGVGEDHWVAHEYAKVRHLYAAKLKIPERTEIEWFDGPHTINGQATYEFLHRHLKWPRPE